MYLKSRVTKKVREERERKRERKPERERKKLRESSPPTGSLPTVTMARKGPGQSQEPEASSGYMLVQWPKDLGCPLLFSQAISRVLGQKCNSQVSNWHPHKLLGYRQGLSLKCHNTSSLLLSHAFWRRIVLSHSTYLNR